MEQVGSITSSSKTTCNGSNRRLAGFIPNKGASNEANAIGIWIANIYPTAFLMLS